MTATAATCPEGARDEAAEVMRCLRHVLREPIFAQALALLVSGNRQGEGRTSAVSDEVTRLASEAM